LIIAKLINNPKMLEVGMEVEEKDYFRGHWPLMQFESYG
jgi:hypothetical protein